MQIKDLLKQARKIWGSRKLNLGQIVVCLGVVSGDICRLAREPKNDSDSDEELKKELGNLIFSTIRWCDDLGFDPEECVESAIGCQKKFKK